jgi:hypothetical protein
MNSWENLFTTAAKTTRQIGDMAGWGHQMFSMIGHRAALWQNLCGTPDSRHQTFFGLSAWNATAEQFRKSMQICLGSWGLNPLDFRTE